MTTMTKVLSTSLIYFGLVFAAGFLLAPVRIMLLVPTLGERLAELTELPVMLLITWLVARWLMRSRLMPYRRWQRMLAGTLALSLMLLAECWVVLFVLEISLVEHFATRDPVAGLAYYLSLLLFAAMPVWVARR
jgi:hypothetical protein